MRRMLLIVLVLGLLLTCSACARTHKITVVDGQDLVDEMPKRAAAGEVVTIYTAFVTDADLYLEVRGVVTTRVKEGVYEFIMPDHDVEVEIWIDTSNQPGS